ncbi:MAG: tyrosine-type recombinase/integrase [Planctomycetota bacterium]|nr:tyrosine-type recombinase/integrase [Planctomycetota bacterium]
MACCITNTGSKSFYLYRKVEGRPVRVRLGGMDISIEQARHLAALANGKIAQGVNPQEAKVQKRDELTLGEVFSRYMDEHAKVRKRTWEEDQGIFDRHLGGLNARRLSQITRGNVTSLHTKIGKGPNEYTITGPKGKTFTKKYPKGSPVSANRVVELLRGVYAWAIRQGIFKGENPAAAISPFPETQRERFLQPDELPRFFEAVKSAFNPVARDCFLVELYTGARRSNVQAMQWDQVNLDRALWTIPASEAKSGREMTVYLSGPAVEILRKRKAEAKSAWVFPGRDGLGHIKDPMRSWRTVLKKAGLQDLRIHDLRRTFGSYQAATGASLPIIGKSLGHTSPQATSVYARLNLDPVRASVDAATDAILKASGQAPQAPAQADADQAGEPADR